MKKKIGCQFPFPIMFYVIEIIDDNDVCHLVGVIEGVRSEMHVYPVEGDGDNRCNVAAKDSCEYISIRLYSNNQICNFISPSVPQYHSVLRYETIMQSPMKYVDLEIFNHVGDHHVVTYVDDVGIHNILATNKRILF